MVLKKPGETHEHLVEKKSILRGSARSAGHIFYFPQIGKVKWSNILLKKQYVKTDFL